MSNMENNNIKIFGKKKSDLILTEEDLNFLKELLTNNASSLSVTTNNKVKGRFLEIMNKISSLSLTQENIYNIFEGLELGNSESIQDLFKNFNFKELINNPKNFINKFEIQNSNLSRKNKNKFEKLSYIINPVNKQTPKSKIGKSILIFFFILSQIVKYIKMKKSIFNGALSRNIRTSSLNIEKAQRAFDEFKFLAKKFLKMREKIFELTQLQYAEESIPKNTIVFVKSNPNPKPLPNFHYFIYYHFFKNEIDKILLDNNKIQNSIVKYSDFVKIKIKEKINFYKNRILFKNINGIDFTFKPDKNPFNLTVCYKYVNSYNSNGKKVTNASSQWDPFGFKESGKGSVKVTGGAKTKFTNPVKLRPSPSPSSSSLSTPSSASTASPSASTVSSKASPKGRGGPQGSGAQPQGSGAQPQGSGAQPQGSGTQPQGSGAQPQGSGAQPQGSGTQPQGSGAQPQVSGVPVVQAKEVTCDYKNIFNINSILYLKKEGDIYEYNVISKRNSSYFLYHLKAQFQGDNYVIIDSKRPQIHFLNINNYYKDEYIDKYGNIILISYKI